MTGVTHTAVGGAIGRFIPNPIIALLVGVVSHLIIDKIPHFWPETKSGQNLMILLDGLFTAVLLLVFILSPLENKGSIIAGGIGGALVDLVFVILPMFWKSFYNNPVRVWHEKRQYHHHNAVWIFTDVAQIVLALSIVYSW